jgi:DNA-binding NtrC family response regulator
MGYRILIIDGNDLVRQSIRDTLESVGFEIHTAVGEDAMEVLDEREIDLVLTERLLPDMDGFSLLWCIKADHPRVPVVVMTTSDRFIVEAMSLGAQDYLVKPFDTAELLETVQLAIEWKERRRREPGNDRHSGPCL